MIITSIILFLTIFIFIGLYISYRISWVTEHLISVLSDASSYLIRQGKTTNESDTKEFFTYIESYLNQKELEFFYWIFKKPFCYDVKKILGDKIYNEIYSKTK
jgi:hypothetical protein